MDDETMVSWRPLPFSLDSGEDFKGKSVQWISDVFYERLPNQGYEIREEQIFTALHMHSAYLQRHKLFAEAGLGTGKTFAYLVGAVLHARRSGRPVIIACGSDSLVGQLTHREGDIARLARALDLDIDARPALDPTQYICARKVRALSLQAPRIAGLKRLLQWAETTRLGARTEVPDVSDKLWNLVRWEEGFDCGQCNVAFHCPVLRARDHYRGAADFIVCSHAFFFRHIRTKQALKEQGHLPLLPRYSAIVFDEAHRLEDAARRALGERITLDDVVDSFDTLLHSGMRESLARLLETAKQTAADLFDCLARQNPVPLQRTAVVKTAEFIASVRSLHKELDVIMDELSIEEGLTNYLHKDYSMDRSAAWVAFERVQSVLASLLQEGDHRVIWMERGLGEDSGISIWSAPFPIGDMMRNEVYADGVPFIFSSATLANGSSFDYMKAMFGAVDAKTSLSASPYDYENQCIVYISDSSAPVSSAERFPVCLARRIVDLLAVSNGRSLVLFRDAETMQSVREALPSLLPVPPWTLLWEGDGTTSHLLSRFTNDELSVMSGVSFWEGISVPGPALTQVIIAQLPFPPDDPVIRMKRSQMLAKGTDPFAAVDVPEMLIKLKQGAGRLIRCATDRGIISCVDASFRGQPYEKEVLAAFPFGARITNDIAEVRAFLAHKRPG